PACYSSCPRHSLLCVLVSPCVRRSYAVGLPSFPTRRSADLDGRPIVVTGAGHTAEVGEQLGGAACVLSEPEPLADLRGVPGSGEDRKSTRLTPVTFRSRMPSSA